MDKTLLSDLKRKIFIRSALISLDSLDEILGLNSYLSGDEILLEIIKKALTEFELTNPLILEMPIAREQMLSCTAPDGFMEIKSNFTLYLKCMIHESRIILVPNSIPQWRIGNDSLTTNINSYYGGSSIPQPGVYTYFTEYRAPYVFVGDLGTLHGFGGQGLIIRGICSRPIVPDFLPDRTFNPKSETSAVYWMNVEYGGARANYFIDLCMVHLLDYIRQLKASISLPNISVDVLSNVDASYQELRSRCDQYALQSGWYGELLM